MRHFTLDQSRNLKCKTPKRIYGAFANGISLSYCLLSLLREKRWGPKDPVVTGELDWSQFLHQKNRQRRICFTVGWQPGWFSTKLFTRCPLCMRSTTNFRFPASHRTHDPEYLWIEASNFSSPDRCSTFCSLIWSGMTVNPNLTWSLPEHQFCSGPTNQHSKNL